MTGPNAAGRKYVPRPTGLNAEFYEAASGGALHLQRCSDCGRFRHPPRYYCAACGSGTYDWAQSDGQGLLFSWTVTHRAYDWGWADDLPYATGVVDIAEGVRVVGALEHVAPEELAIGLPVRAHLAPVEEGFVFISFRPR